MIDNNKLKKIIEFCEKKIFYFFLCMDKLKRRHVFHILNTQKIKKNLEVLESRLRQTFSKKERINL